MGVGGKFWDLLRPYGRQEGFDFLSNKRVAVDLSFWIIQHETAVKGFVLKPHLRLAFFRTINLFSKFGAYPVFVVDGTLSPLKSQARISRIFRSSAIDISNLPVSKDGVSVERNKLFCEWVRECVELLELLRIPVVKAKGGAEALCAQLNSKGYVDACITPDSDAFLFGAKCVIKGIKPNSREPFECYRMSDIEAGLGLGRKHLIGISLLIGNDYDSGGVFGIGVDKALHIVRQFSEDDILERVHDIGKRSKPAVLGGTKPMDDGEESHSEIKKSSSHCNRCGQLDIKRTRFTSSCKHCGCDSDCSKKALGFRCESYLCSMDRDLKDQNKTEIKVCEKNAQGPEYPNKGIIELYLSDGFTGDESSMTWGTPDTEMLVDFMVFKLRWNPSYARKMLLPLLSTIYLRERARNKTENPLLCDKYEFHSIKCMKARYGHEFFVIRWRKPISTSGFTHGEPEMGILEEELVEEEENGDPLDCLNEPQVEDSNGEYFLLTDECIGLVQSAFPDETEQFLREKKLREMSKKNVCEESATPPRPRPMTMGVQRSIHDFYRSKKAAAAAAESIERGGSSRVSSSSSAEKKRQATSTSSSNLSKSVRRRLLF